MTKKEYTLLVDSMESKTRDNGEQFYSIKDSEIIGEELHQFLVHKCLNRIDDTSYSILNEALYIFSDIELKDVKDFDVYEYDGDIGSVYTADMLSYLNPWNDSDIADIMKDYECETISQACGLWYDQEVRTVFNLIQEYIVKVNI